MKSRKSLGSYIESFVSDYLQKLGLKKIMRNYRWRYGEIDLIMQDKDDIVFVEVRSRRSTLYGTPLETITFMKRRKLIITARHFLEKYNLVQASCRFDVVAVETKHQPWNVLWVQNAFQENDG